MSEQMREAFEQWALDNDCSTWRFDGVGTYVSERTDYAWRAWQAASAIRAQQAEPLGYALFRDGKQCGVERTMHQAQRWVDAVIVPLCASVGITDAAWQPMESVPRDASPILVLLEKEMQKSRVHSAYYHPNVVCIGGCFEFDAPKAIGWMRQPPIPEAPKEPK